MLHALGLEPLAASAFTLSAGFEGDQWTFFKFPPEDLRRVFGLEVAELNVWKPVLDHVLEQLDLGRLCTVEADSWFLPDTRGDSYHEVHVKSTVVPQMVDVEGRRLGYFHNAGYFELDGDDFDGVFQRGSHADPTKLPPYVEVIRHRPAARRRRRAGRARGRAHPGAPGTPGRGQPDRRDERRTPPGPAVAGR